jgi:hypothetical protein
VGFTADAISEGRCLLLQGVRLHALFVESGGGEANALLGRGCILVEVGLRLEF